jgi:hypothetical protein
MEKKYIVLRESLTQSIISDGFTLIMLSFCVYISQDSTWWAFVTGIMFIVFLYGKISSVVDKNTEFNSLQSLKDWVDKEMKDG